MAFTIYTPPKMSPVAFSGAIEFRDMFIPKPSTDAWGVDTMERQLKGPICAFEKWYDSIAQGGQYKDPTTGVVYYVQTKSPIQDKIWPGASILLKGFSNGIPKPLIRGAQHDISATITCSSPQKATRLVKATSWQTVYRYITNGKPTGPKYTSIDVNIDIYKNIYSSEITLENGVPLYGIAPADLVTALTTVGYKDLANLDSYESILGTPNYECQDTVTRLFPVQQ